MCWLGRERCTTNMVSYDFLLHKLFTFSSFLSSAEPTDSFRSVARYSAVFGELCWFLSCLGSVEYLRPEDRNWIVWERMIAGSERFTLTV